MKGYFRRPDLTNSVVRRGWFKTGDIGLLDERGRLFLKGRERDEINKGGVKIYPDDIDHVVLQFKATTDACTFRFTDDLYGENVGIAVVLADQRSNTLRNLYQWLETHLARHKHPARWYLLDELPRNSRGKINRDTVMRLCGSREPLDLVAALRETD